MSCQFKSIASIVDLDKVKRCLFTTDNFSPDSFDDDSWNWSVDEAADPVKDSWLDECCISLSPSSELLVFSRERNLVILTAKWDGTNENEGRIKYIISWNGDVTQSFSERITAVLCLPIAGQGKLSAHCGPDWTAVAVGFSSGALRFYTEKGSFLLSEMLHDEPVKSIKCQSFQPSFSTHIAPQVDELHVIYAKVVCVVHGFALCNSLKACRNQLARVEANCCEKIEAPPLAMVKWSLPEQEGISDSVVLGTSTASIFNHLTTASVRGGFYATFRSSPPQVSTVLSCGNGPYVAWHGLVEGSAGPVLTDVAKAVASKLKSAIGSAVPSWLGVGRRTSEEKPKEKILIEPAESMSCIFGLCDYIRKGERIYVSPNKNLSVVCDSLGRVILVDNVSGLALRFWKGYRDAECSFISVSEDKSPTSARKALYLAIYAPKKGIIEVWALQQGPKIATFPATKTGKLLYIKYGLMGVNPVSMKCSNSSSHPGVFITGDGDISQIIVPFHAILSNKSDPRHRDRLVLRQVKKWLHSASESQINEFEDLCKQIKTNEFSLQVLESAASCKHVTPAIMQTAIDVFQAKNETSGVDGEADEYVEKCKIACSNLKKLVQFYSTTLNLQDAPPLYNTVVPNSPQDDEMELAKMLRLSEIEIKRLFLLTSLSIDNGRSVQFVGSEKKFSIFLSSFVGSFSSESLLSFSPSTSSEDFAVIGEVFCQCVLYGTFPLDEWKAQASNSGIDAWSLMQASVSYWLRKPLGHHIRSEMFLFMQILQVITTLVTLKESVSWWAEVRKCIVESNNALNALTATIIARAIHLTCEEQASDDKDDGDSEWEKITEETCLWSQLLTQVEAIAILQLALSYKPKRSPSLNVFPRLDYTRPEISLHTVLSKGPGLVSEAVAKWISSWGLPPEWLLTYTNTPRVIDPKTNISVAEGIAPDIDESSEAKPTTVDEEKALQHLSTLREYFPYCLSSSHLLANVTWEYLLAWSKDLEKMDLISTALMYLNEIPNAHLKQGLCSIIWNVHLKLHFENTAKLLHKIGKLPKERLCRQHINLSDVDVKTLLKYIHEFQDLYVDCVKMSLTEEEKAKFAPTRETLWTSSTPDSLSEIAFNQKVPNLKIVRLQNICVRALQFLAVFPIRLHRPITTLFHSSEEPLLWTDLKQTSGPSSSPDPKLDESRLTYLSKVIICVIDRLSESDDVESAREATFWVSRCFALACDWSLPLETLRITQVVYLYKNNRDRYAEDVLGTVNDKEKLGTELLTVVGERMKRIIMSSRDSLKERMANLSPSLTTWIHEQKESKEVSDLRDTVQLAALVTTLLPENSADHKFAQLLLEGISPLVA